jgi:hypothetical protein
VERIGRKNPKDVQLRHEYKVYREIARSPVKAIGFCTAEFFGSTDKFNFLIFDLLGSSLSELFRKCGKKFSLKTGKLIVYSHLVVETQAFCDVSSFY